MPTLEWIAKDKIVNHHIEVPFRVLDRKYSFDENGQHVEDNGSKNMIIHGDNLDALKALLPNFEGKIKCIYIDPPYNTGNENWSYNDNVNDPKIKKWLGEVVGPEGEDLSRHDKWICMMYPRLRLLHKLLAEDGAIFISIDDNEISNLRLIMDEIFGRNRFVSQITLLCNPKGRSQDKYFATCHEYLLVYSKNQLPAGSFNVEKADEKILKDYPHGEEGSRYRLLDLRNTHREFGKHNRPNLWYPFFVDPDTKTVSLERDIIHTIEVLPYWDDGYEGCWTWGKDLAAKDINLLIGILAKKGERWRIKRKSHAMSENGERVEKRLFTIWNDPRFYTEKGQTAFGKIFPGTSKSDFPQPKSVEYISEIIRCSTKDGDYILDSFAGSGTTANAVININRKEHTNRHFILIEMMDYAETYTSERIKRIITGNKNQIEEHLLFSKKVTLSDVKNNSKLLKTMDEFYQSIDDSLYESVNPPQMKDRSIIITGNRKVNGSDRCDFSYYELGHPLLTSEGQLNENIDESRIREYIYYSETKNPLNPENKEENRYFLGYHNNTAYYFYYDKNSLTSLDYNFLATIRKQTESYVIYADVNTLSNQEMLERNITFKKIPRDIAKL